MDAADIAETIHGLLIELTEIPPAGEYPDTVTAVALDGPHVLITTSEGKVYRVTVEPWP